MTAKVIVSRCDRIGDLVLSLPVLHHLRRAGVSEIVLHCSEYAHDVGLWAQHNGLCEEVVVAGKEEALKSSHDCWGLALFDCSETRQAFKSWNLSQSVAPRSKISGFWNYQFTVAQHRSRVEMSEMRYNIALANYLVDKMGLSAPQFEGLPALEVCPEFFEDVESAHDVLVFCCNGNSAANWPMEKYLEYIKAQLDEGRRVDLLIAGHDAEEREEIFQNSTLANEGIRVFRKFDRVGKLLAFISTAKEVLASSTGPLHLAHAAGVAVTGIYPIQEKVESFERWRPDGYWHQAALRLIEF